MSMQSGFYIKYLPALVKSGEVPMARLDESVSASAAGSVSRNQRASRSVTQLPSTRRRERTASSISAGGTRRGFSVRR